MVSPLGRNCQVVKSEDLKRHNIHGISIYTYTNIYIYTLGMYTCMYVDHAYGIYYIHNHNMMVYIYIRIDI